MGKGVWAGALLPWCDSVTLLRQRDLARQEGRMRGYPQRRQQAERMQTLGLCDGQTPGQTTLVDVDFEHHGQIACEGGRLHMQRGFVP